MNNPYSEDNFRTHFLPRNAKERSTGFVEEQIRKIQIEQGRIKGNLAGYPSSITDIFKGKNKLDPGHRHEAVTIGETVVNVLFGALGGADLDKEVLGSGLITGSLGFVSMTTGSTNPSYAQIQNGLTSSGEGVLFSSQKVRFQTRAKFGSNVANQVAYMMVGNPFANTNEEEGFGFKVVNDTLYALHIWSNGVTLTEVTTAIPGITLTAYNEYGGIFDGRQCIFFVNGLQKAIHLNNMPHFDQETRFTLYIQNNGSAANRQLFLTYFYFRQTHN